MGCALLVPCQYKFYRRVVKDVKKRKDRPSRIAEYDLDSFFLKRLY